MPGPLLWPLVLRTRRKSRLSSGKLVAGAEAVNRGNRGSGPGRDRTNGHGGLTRPQPSDCSLA